MEVKVVNLHRRYKINERLVKKIAASILRHCAVGSNSKLEIVFLTDGAIRLLNKRYKGENRPTDVLSFDLGGGLFGTDLFSVEIFISIDTALKNSRLFGTTLPEEVVLYIIHGILHLTGYDDVTRKGRASMEEKQEEVLKRLCRKENLSKVLTPQ